MKINEVITESLKEAHPNSKIYDKCWDGYKKVPGKKIPSAPINEPANSPHKP